MKIKKNLVSFIKAWYNEIECHLWPQNFSTLAQKNQATAWRFTNLPQMKIKTVS